MPTPSGLLSTAEVAVLLGKSTRTVLRMVDAGELVPADKAPGIRGALLFNPDDIVATEAAS